MDMVSESLWTGSHDRDWNISETIAFIFHHSIQHDEASGETNAVFNQKWVFNTETIL